MRLENKVCIITGSSKGIGFGIAERFAREGAVATLIPAGKRTPGRRWRP